MPSSAKYRSPRRSNRKTLVWARIQLLVLFVVLEGLDSMLYFAAGPRTQHDVLGGILIRALWSVVCVVAIWMRHNWARYLLVIRLLWSGILTALLELSYTETAVETSRLIVAGSSTLGHILVAVALIASPAIRKLTHPNQHFDVH